MQAFEIASIVKNLQSVATTPYLIAIDGPGCAGKSTLAAGLASAVDGSVVHGDDFYRVLDPAKRELLNAEEGYEQYFDWQRLRQEVLTPLNLGHPAKYKKYQWASNSLEESVLINPIGIVIVEGVYSFRPELRNLYQKSIFVHASPKLREERARLRGQDSEAWIRRWMAAEDYYLHKFSPQRDADVVFDGETGRLLSDFKMNDLKALW